MHNRGGITVKEKEEYLVEIVPTINDFIMKIDIKTNC